VCVPRKGWAAWLPTPPYVAATLRPAAAATWENWPAPSVYLSAGLLLLVTLSCIPAVCQSPEGVATISWQRSYCSAIGARRLSSGGLGAAMVQDLSAFPLCSGEGSILPSELVLVRNITNVFGESLSG
jgi:hypothetical protein